MESKTVADALEEFDELMKAELKNHQELLAAEEARHKETVEMLWKHLDASIPKHT